MSIDFACVGRFYRNSRLHGCRECARCQLHLAYLYEGAPLPEYQRPSACKRDNRSLSNKPKKK